MSFPWRHIVGGAEDSVVLRGYPGVVATKLSLTAVFEPVDEGWTQARIVELPAVITAGPTRDEAREMLLDALREYLLSLGQEEAAVEVRDPASSEPLEITLGA